MIPLLCESLPLCFSKPGSVFNGGSCVIPYYNYPLTRREIGHVEEYRTSSLVLESTAL